jgi:1-acyl-sn-glycerol-3-phosphate acyltransferase
MNRPRPWNSDARARPRPFTFYPPLNSRWVTRLAQRFVLRDMRHKSQVGEVEVLGDGLERLERLRGERCLVTPSHCGGFEPHVLMYLSKLLGMEFNFLAAQELFEQSRLQQWLLPRLGVYSILRGAVDRPSFAMTRQILAEGKRWLVIFPEGESILQGSTVMPFQQGVFQLAFKAYEDALKTDADANFFCIPLAIKYVYQQDMHAEIDASLARLEASLAIAADATPVSRYMRMRRAAEAILAVNEQTHQVHPSEGAALGERIDGLKLRVVARMESQLEITPRPGEKLLDRVRALFNAVDRIVFEESPASDYERRLAIERRQVARDLYDDLWRLLRFVAIYDGYVRESMTVERFLDVLVLMETEVFGGRRMWGPRRALVEVGEPLNLKDHLSAYAADRRSTVASVTQSLESTVRAMIDGLGSDAKVVE